MASFLREPGRLGLEREKPGPQRPELVWSVCPMCAWPRERVVSGWGYGWGPLPRDRGCLVHTQCYGRCWGRGDRPGHLPTARVSRNSECTRGE